MNSIIGRLKDKLTVKCKPAISSMLQLPIHGFDNEQFRNCFCKTK